MDTPNRMLLAAALLTHFLALAVWLGAMLFNLVVNFPAQRARAGGSSAELTSSMGQQASRAAPWLVVLVALVVASGLGLQLLKPGSPLADGGAGMALKWLALAMMAALHAWGSRWLWPRIYFALQAERPALFLRYQLAMAGSAALGIAAAGWSFWLRSAAH